MNNNMYIISLLLIVYASVGIVLGNTVYTSYKHDKDILIIAIVSGFIWPIVIIAFLIDKLTKRTN